MWQVQRLKSEDNISWIGFYQDILTFIICRYPNGLFNVTLYKDKKVTRLYNYDVLKANDKVRSFVDEHGMCDMTLLYILFRIF